MFKAKSILTLLVIAAVGLAIGCSKMNIGPTADEMKVLSLTGNKATLTQVSSFGTNPGAVAMYKYVPSGVPSNAPLVMAIHGCTQDAQTYENDTKWSSLADKWKFYVVYPQQASGNNQNKCWNFFESGDQTRGSGEALSLKQMVDKMKTDYSIDASRVYVTGLSSGGAFTNVMAACYPDVFAGAAPMAGIPYKCASGMTDAFSCMSPGVDKTATAWGNLIKGCYSGYSGPWPLVSIWQGTTDSTVKPMNATETMEGWTNVHGIDQTPEVNAKWKNTNSVHKVYKNSSGVAKVETWDIDGMAHGISVDPGTGTDQGGTTNSYSIDKDIWSSYYAAKFWGLDNTDSTAPTVSITAPSDSASVSGETTVSASASDNVGVTKVEFYVDGQLVSTDTSSPYSISVNFGNYTNGSHTLIAKAYDAVLNVGISASISVTVSGGVSDTANPSISITSPAASTTVHGPIKVVADASDNFGVTKVEFYVDGNLQYTDELSPYEYAMDTTAFADGSHSLTAKAFDAAGNNATSSSVSVTVDNTIKETNEAVSAASSPYTNLTWTLGGWAAATDAYQSASRSLYGIATRASTGTTTVTATTCQLLGSKPVLSFYRKLDFNVNNTLDYNKFQFVVSTWTADNCTGTETEYVVNEKSVTGADFTEAMSLQSNIDLTAYANKKVSLKMKVITYNSIYISTHAKAWIDDINIKHNGSGDLTAPAVTITAPSAGATVSNDVTITATLVENVTATAVEFFIDDAKVGEDTTSPYSFTWTTSNVTNGSHYIKARAVDGSKNLGEHRITVTVSNSNTVVATSVDAKDGDIYNGQLSGTILPGSAYIAIGTLAYEQRGIMSFDTSAIPDAATISEAKLTVECYSYWGSCGSSGSITIDVKNGYFGTSDDLEEVDWDSTATASAVATIDSFSSGQKTSAAFSTAGKSAINKTGITQVRLSKSGGMFYLQPGAKAYLTIKY